ncbi:hypothetical protein [Agromyces larvae]|uniref:DUF1707 domain-containing protein n=1 Tax=Agromyces larvae TaxID=2929802 RepID=A0ABY4BYJ3_9MICO|nr:hypothetical protein [Agromyces larvae]UOE44257.1 hypothetical protein MTO99_00190 [Agromyces larvae]
MSAAYPDARAWAQDQSLANVPTLARLEAFAFQAHPEIVESFGAEGRSLAPFLRRPRRSPTRLLRNALMLLTAIVVLVAPILGVAIYADAPPYLAPTAEPVAAPIAVPISSISFAVAALTQAVACVVWLRSGARRSIPLLTGAAATAVLAGFASVGLPRVAARDGFELGGWIVPVWVALVVATAVALALVMRLGVRPPANADAGPDPAPIASTVSDREHARMLVRRLPADERRLLQQDRDDALRILAARGLLDDDEVQRALAADLGTLFTLDPIRTPAP